MTLPLSKNGELSGTLVAGLVIIAGAASLAELFTLGASVFLFLFLEAERVPLFTLIVLLVEDVEASAAFFRVFHVLASTIPLIVSLLSR